jgi:coenzyme F420-reducing hydrogenase beta subunit
LQNKKYLNVIKEDLCIACGACSMVENDININLNKTTGLFEPQTDNEISDFNYCPSVKVDYVELQNKIFGLKPDSIFGVVDSVFLAQSMDFKRNNKASSGGLIKEIGSYYYENNPESDGIIALGENEGLDYSAKLIKSFNEFDKLPGSIYHQINFQDGLKILKNVKNNAGLVAIPCVLEGIYNYIFSKEPELINKINLTIGLLCGWTYSHKSVDAMKQYHKIEEKVENISYRGNGPIGKLKIKTKNDSKEFSRRVNFSYQVAFDRSFNSPRCLVCVNHSNYLAEIVIGDAWLPSTVFTKTGISLVITRTKKATEMIKQMKKNNRIECLEVSSEEILASQSADIVSNSKALERIEYLKSNNFFVPEFTLDDKIFKKNSFSNKTRKEMKNIRKKRIHIANNRFKLLYYRKLFYELPSYLRRYTTWFTKRILRIESIKGTRKEIPFKKLKVFK